MQMHIFIWIVVNALLQFLHPNNKCFENKEMIRKSMNQIIHWILVYSLHEHLQPTKVHGLNTRSAWKGYFHYVEKKIEMHAESKKKSEM